jgi:Ser/Thr protein kinase RdoA (MazF antagonist)
MNDIEGGFSPALLTDYGLEPIIPVRKLTGGISNDVYLIETPDQKYVYKKYRYTSPQVEDQVRFFQFLESHSFPVPHIVPKKTNNEVSSSDTGVLYEFVPGYCPPEPNILTDNQLEQAGHTLGIYHSLVHNVSPELLEQRAPSVPSNPNNLLVERVNPDHYFSITDAIGLWHKVQTKIKEKQFPDSIDEQMLQVLPTMLHTLNSVDVDEVNELVRTNPKIFGHGDYQGTNLIFGSTDIHAVIDWDMRGMLSKSWEVLYAATVMCKVRNTENFNTPLDLQRVKIFMDAYREKHELTDKEIVTMPLMAYTASLATPHLLQAHYLKGNSSLDRFFPQYANDWFWWQNNYQRFFEVIK